MTTDLTVGKPSQKLFWFSIPLLLSVAFQQLYQMADSIIVGRFAETVEAGELALAAVGASYPITQLFVAVATGINIGTGVLVSQLFGAKRYLRMKTAISTALLTTAAADADRSHRYARHHERAVHAGEYLCGRLAVSARVCVWSAVPVYL